jgi:hypothetical protein
MFCPALEADKRVRGQRRSRPGQGRARGVDRTREHVLAMRSGAAPAAGGEDSRGGAKARVCAARGCGEPHQQEAEVRRDGGRGSPWQQRRRREELVGTPLQDRGTERIRAGMGRGGRREAVAARNRGGGHRRGQIDGGRSWGRKEVAAALVERGKNAARV